MSRRFFMILPFVILRNPRAGGFCEFMDDKIMVMPKAKRISMTGPVRFVHVKGEF
jgi:hypothetical protein